MSEKSPTKTDKKPIYKKWWFWVIIVVLVVGIAGAGSNNNTKNSDDASTSDTATSSSKSSDSGKDNSRKLGDTFEFDGLEISLGTDYSFVTINNQFSEHNGASVIKLPITVKNLKEENHSLNMFYIKTFGAQGTELDGISIYFMDEDCIEFAGELRPGASYTKYLYFLYDGDGEYVVEFSQLLGSGIEVSFDVEK